MRRALASGNLAEVHASLSRLRSIGPVGADVCRRAGRVAMQKESYREALHYFERILERHKSAATWVAIGQLAAAQGQAEQVRAAYQSALELNPNLSDALFLLGSEWLRHDEPELALALLGRAAAIVPDDSSMQASVKRARKRLAQREAAVGNAAPESAPVKEEP